MSNKLNYLLFFSIMIISDLVWAVSPEAQLLIDRAHYWEKSGRHDTALISWRLLLQIEPANAEALLALSEKVNNASPLPAPVASGIGREMPSQSTSRIETIKPSIEPQAESSRNELHKGTVQATTNSELVTKAETNSPEAKKVEDWPDLFSGVLPAYAEDQQASRETTIEQNIEHKSVAQELTGAANTSENISLSASPAPLAKPSVSTNNEDPVKADTANSVALIKPPARNKNEGQEKTTYVEKINSPQELHINSSRHEAELNLDASQAPLNTTKLNTLTPEDNPGAFAERAVYWEKRGRSDLAEKLRKQLAPIDSVKTQDNHALTIAPVVITEKPAKTSEQAVQLQIYPEPDAEAMAQYWDARGRSDLAGEIRKQSAPVEQEQTPVSQVLSVTPVLITGNLTASDRATPVTAPLTEGLKTVPSLNTTAQGKSISGNTVHQEMSGALPPAAKVPDSSAKTADQTLAVEVHPEPDTEAMARYWDTRGRSDLAEKIRKHATPKRNETVPRNLILPVYEAIPEVPVTEQLGAQKADNDEKARYWEAHGRSDLVAQLRVKLGKIEQSEPVVQHSTEISVSADAKQSAPEKELFKKAGNLQTRLDLAQAYRAANELDKARAQITSVLTDQADMPEAIFASAQLYAQQCLWPETLSTLEKIAPLLRTDEMGRLQKTAWAHVQIDRADALVRQGKNQEADLLLRQVAVQISVNYNQSVPVEPPPLWKSTVPKQQDNKP